MSDVMKIQGFPNIVVTRCTCCKVTLSKWTLPKGSKGPICKNCLSVDEGGIFFLTKEGEKLGVQDEVQNKKDQTSMLVSCPLQGPRGYDGDNVEAARVL